jgi:hypothetical protein
MASVPPEHAWPEDRMTRGRRLLAWTLAVHAIGTAAASAQTVIVRGVPAGNAVELVVNTTAVGSTPADPNGDARIAFDLSTTTGKAETEAYVHVDACGTEWRVLLVEAPVTAPPPDAGCERRDIAGLFVIRPVTTVIVNAAPTVPTLILRQGSVNLSQLGIAVTAPTGLMIFVGGGYGQFGQIRDIACGTVPGCSGSLFRPGLTGGVLYWITPSIGAEVAYVWPQPVELTGGAGRFTFDSSLDTRVLTIAGKFGGPAGRARIYGEGGLNYHEAVFSTTERVDELVITGADGSTGALVGGTWANGTKTSGWSWMAGGGVEAWLSRRFALYGEGTWVPLKGTADEGEATLDDRLFSFRAGVRLRIGG